MALRKPKNTNDVDALRAQRSELAGRLGAVGGQLERLDPVNDWELASRALAEQSALERAVGALDERIAAARLVEHDEAAAQREQDRVERAAAARLALEVKARAVCALVQRIDANELAELRAAAWALAAAGATPDPSAAVALRLVGAVDAALAQFRVHAPEWLGLPTPPTAQQLALIERSVAVAVAEARLAEIRKLRSAARHGGPTPSPELLTTMAGGVAGARQCLFALTDPALAGDELFRKVTAGLEDELGGYIENHWEARRKAEGKRLREQQDAIMA